jgi:PGF-CTERM protein
MDKSPPNEALSALFLTVLIVISVSVVPVVGPVSAASGNTSDVNWPTFSADDANTGHVDSTGPTSNISKEWNFTTAGTVSQSATVVDGTIYVGGGDNVYALDVDTGNKQWQFSTGGFVGTAPTYKDGTIYVGSNDNNVYALDATTGTEQWKFTTGAFVRSTPVVVGGTVYVGSNDANLYAIDAATGTEDWHYTTGDMVGSSPAIVGDTVYFGSDDNNVYALNATNGDKRWNYTTGFVVSSSPAVVDGTVYVGSADGNVYALDANTGSEQWQFGIGWQVDTSPAVEDGTVYVGGGNDLYAIDAATGTEKWQLIKTNIVTDPAVVNGTVYFGNHDTKVYAVDGSTKEEQWNFSTDQLVSASPAVLNGTVYIGSGDDNVYALTGDESGGPSQADFSVTIDSTNSPVDESETLDVTLTVENTGEQAGTQTVTLSTDGAKRDSTALTLASGESTSVTLSWETDSNDAGEYTATVSSDNDRDSTAVSVVAPTTSTPTETPAHTDTANGDGGGGGGEYVPPKFLVSIGAQLPGGHTISGTNSPISEGEKLNVSAAITNPGDGWARKSVQLLINGTKQDSKETRLESGETNMSVPLYWETSAGDAGVYNATVRTDDDSASANIIVQYGASRVTLSDQSVVDSKRQEVVVDSAYFSEGGFVVIYNTNETGDLDSPVGSSNYLGRDTEHTNIRVNLDDPISDSETLVAVLHNDTNGNNFLDYDGGQTDAPLVESGEFITDSARIRRRTPTPTPTATPTPTPIPPTYFRVNARTVSLQSVGYAGNTQSVTAELENRGAEGTQPVRLIVNGTERDRTSFQLNEWEKKNATFSWKTTRGDVGTHNVTVVSSNDSAKATVRLKNGKAPYFSISPEHQVYERHAGESVTLDTTIENEGDLTGTQTVNLKINGTRQDATSVTLNGRNSSGTGDQSVVSLELNTTGISPGRYTATIESANESKSVTIGIEPASTASEGGPGFGIGVTLVALIMAIVVARLRIKS